MKGCLPDGKSDRKNHCPWTECSLPIHPLITLKIPVTVTFNVHIWKSTQKHFSLSDRSSPRGCLLHLMTRLAMQWVGWSFCTLQSNSTFASVVHLHSVGVLVQLCSARTVNLCNAQMLSAPSHSAAREALTWPRTQGKKQSYTAPATSLSAAFHLLPFSSSLFHMVHQPPFLLFPGLWNCYFCDNQNWEITFGWISNALFSVNWGVQMDQNVKTNIFLVSNMKPTIETTC